MLFTFAQWEGVRSRPYLNRYAFLKSNLFRFIVIVWLFKHSIYPTRQTFGVVALNIGLCLILTISSRKLNKISCKTKQTSINATTVSVHVIWHGTNSELTCYRRFPKFTLNHHSFSKILSAMPNLIASFSSIQ